MLSKELSEQLFRLLFVEEMKYDDISKKLNIERKIISKNYDEIKHIYNSEYQEINRLKRNIFNPKRRKFKGNFKFENFAEFYDWHKSQGNTCFYCGTEQHKIRTLVEEGKKENPFGIYSSQLKNRGRNLELERINSKSNDYSDTNCALVCYFCNNDKSNVITGEDYIKFFKIKGLLKARKQYIDDKYSFLMKERSKEQS